MAKSKFIETLTGGSVADKAEARLSKLSAQLAETDLELEAAGTRRAAGKRDYVEALGNGADLTPHEDAIATTDALLAKLTERREALAGLVSKATGEAQEARRASTLGTARETLAEALSEAQDEERKAVGAFIEAGKAAGRLAEASRRCSNAAAAVALLDPEADPVNGPSVVLLPFAVERFATAEGLRPVGSLPVTLNLYA